MVARRRATEGMERPSVVQIGLLRVLRERISSDSAKEATESAFPRVYGDSINLGFEGVKHVTTLSAGSTVLIGTFLRAIFPNLTTLSTGIKVMIGTAFVAFGLSLVFACSSFIGLATLSRRRRDFRSPRSRRRYRRYLTLPIAFYVTGLMLFSVAVLARFSGLKLSFTEWGDYALVGTFSAVWFLLVSFVIWYLWWDPRNSAKLSIAGELPSRNDEIDNYTPRIEVKVTDKHSGLPPLNIRLFVDREEEKNHIYDTNTGCLTCDRAKLGIGKTHTVEVVATDARGKQATKEWEFNVKSKRSRHT